MTRQQLRLAGIDEVRALLGATEQQAEDLVSSAGFPQPLATLDAGRVWDLDDIDRWRTTHNDTPPTEDN